MRTILRGKVSFDTEDLPPIPIYEKMAKDGLVFKIDWLSEDMIEWGIGHGEEWDPNKNAFAEEYSKLQHKRL